jgi:chromosomal replication initiator protein
MSMDATQLWQAALNVLQQQVARKEYETWLKTSSIADFDNGTIIVAMPNTFAVEWVENRIKPLVERTLSEIVGYALKVRFVVRQGNGYFVPPPAQDRASAMALGAMPIMIARERERNGAPGVNETPARYEGPEGMNGAGSTAQAGSGASLNNQGGVMAGMLDYPARVQENGNGNGYGPEAGMPAANGAVPTRYSATTRNGSATPAEISMDESTPLNPKYVFENFIVGASNRMAHAASMAVAEKPAHAYNPLFLYGGVGLGKTHLLHAIGHYALNHYSGMRVLYVSSEKFTNDMINAIRDNSNEEFRNRYRTIDILMIDDIQFIAGKDSTQEEFFHTFNALHGAGKQIVISSDRPPKAILTLEDRLRSRFEGGLIADIQPPDLETRTAILRAKAESQQIPIPSEVIDYVAHKVQSNIRELEGALNRIVAFALLNQRPLTTEVAGQALSDLAGNSRRRQITPSRVVETVASFYNLDVEDLKAKSRSREIVVPRQIAMYIIREETDTSLTDIGAEFGNRDHTTVMHACDKIEKAKETDNQIRQAVLSIRQMLYGEVLH